MVVINCPGVIATFMDFCIMDHHGHYPKPDQTTNYVHDYVRKTLTKITILLIVIRFFVFLFDHLSLVLPYCNAVARAPSGKSLQHLAYEISHFPRDFWLRRRTIFLISYRDFQRFPRSDLPLGTT